MSTAAATSRVVFSDALSVAGAQLSLDYHSEIGLVTFSTGHFDVCLTAAQIRKLQLWLSSVLESELILNDFYGEQLWEDDK